MVILLQVALEMIRCMEMLIKTLMKFSSEGQVMISLRHTVEMILFTEATELIRLM